MSEPGTGRPAKIDPAETARVARQFGADIVVEDRERRTAVDRHHDIVARLVDAAHRADRHAALRQPGRDRDLGRQQQPRQTGGAERAGVVPAAADMPGEQRLRRVVRHQPADQKGAARGGGIDGRAQQVGAARIAVDQRERRRDGLDPAGMRSRQIGGRIVGRAEQPEAVRRQVREQQGGGRAVMDFASGGADAEPDPADPGSGPGRLGQLADELRQGRAGRLADIQHAERGALSFGQLTAAAARRGLAGSPSAKAAAKRALMTALRAARRHRGAMRSTITATPRAFGWRPSG